MTITIEAQKQYVSEAKATGSMLEWTHVQSGMHFNRLTAKPRLIRYRGRWWCFKVSEVSCGLDPIAALERMGIDAMPHAAAMDGVFIQRRFNSNNR